MTLKRVYIRYALIGLLVIFIFYQATWDEIDKYNQRHTRILLKESKTKKLIFGHIIETSQRPKSDLYIVTYIYVQDNITFKVKRRCGFRYDKIKFDSNKYFPIIIDSIRPAESYILLTRQDFNTFNLPQPDTLTWLFKYSDY